MAGLVIVAGLLLLVFGLFTGRKAADENNRLTVAASFYPLAHFSQKAGGPDVEVHMITPSGADSHDFEPTPRDLKKIGEADVFIYNGAGLDPWAERVAPSLKTSGIETIEMSSGLTLMKAPEEHGHEEDGHGHEGALDPHTWLDPLLAAEQVAIIGEALAKADPDNASSYRSRSSQYAGELKMLHDEYANGLAACRTRDIIVAHDAFSYLGKRYNLNIIPVTGVFAGEEPSPKRMAEVVRLAKEKGIKYIFFEPLSSPKTARIMARETGAEVLELNPLEGLTKEEEASGKDYISIMRGNLINLRKALGCG